MAITLQLVDGTTTVDLNGTNSTGTGAILEAGYTPRSMKPDETEVTESARIRFKDTTLSAVLATIRNAELLLTQAKRYADSERGPIVYLKFKPDASETLYRARVYGGSLDYDRAALGAQLKAKLFKIDFDWTRGIWEADSEVELTAGGGVAIVNHDDATAGHDNFVDIAAANVGGVVPAGCRIEITNTYATNTLGRVYVGMNAFKNGTMPTHILEGESATGMSTVVDANSSGGNYGTYTISGTASQLAGRWTISAAEVNKYAGHFYHILLRAPVSNNNIYAQVKVLYTATAVVLAETAEVAMNAYALQDLGVLQIPPYLQTETDYQAVDIALYVRGANAAVTYCDFIQLTGTDGWRIYERATTNSIPQNGTLKDDSATGRYWVDGIATTNRIVLNVATGAPLYLYPGRDHRIYVLAMNADAGSEIARTFTVKVFYRPRRLTL